MARKTKEAETSSTNLSEVPLNKEQVFSLIPKNIDEATKMSELIAKSDLVPNDFRNKPGNVLIAVQMGLEVGLPPLQALQNIAVINGRPCIWGDAMLAIVQNHKDYEWHKETGEAGAWAEFTIKRKGAEPHTVRFTKDMAVAAKLWGKQGPWTNYPDRMLQMRARSWGCRDQFADALKGFQSAEEMSDIRTAAIDTTTVETFKEPKAQAAPEPAPTPAPKQTETAKEKTPEIAYATVSDVKRFETMHGVDGYAYRIYDTEHVAYITGDIEVAKTAKKFMLDKKMVQFEYQSQVANPFDAGVCNLLKSLVEMKLDAQPEAQNIGKEQDLFEAK